MTLILVTHDTASPSLYGAVAAIVADERGAGFAHLPARFDTARYPDAVQHVAASGELLPSGLLWFERHTGRDIGPAATVWDVLRESRIAEVVVPLHPGVTLDGLPEALRGLAEAAGVTVEHLTVEGDISQFALRHTVSERAAELPSCWIRDGFGRLVSPPVSQSADDHGATLRIGLVGAESDHRGVYPGALSALGDAADDAMLAVEVMFLDPKSVRAHEVRAVLADLDGVLLPGGSDMGNVLGQISIARGALDAGVPTVGLCLGMQTMTTAFAQRLLGSASVNLAEADPTASLHSFVAMAEDPGLLPHRLGELNTVPVAGTRYGDLPDSQNRERFNHRYRLNPILEPALVRAGMRVSARDRTGTIVDAVEVGAHPFFIGLQGHPELRSRMRLPHPVLSAFVQACRRVSEAGSSSSMR